MLKPAGDTPALEIFNSGLDFFSPQEFRESSGPCSHEVRVDSGPQILKISIRME